MPPRKKAAADETAVSKQKSADDTAVSKHKPTAAPAKEEAVAEVAKKKDILLPEVNIGTIGHIAHGKTTIVHALTGKWTQEHSEEIKRGLTIRLGYADFTVRRCPKCQEPECYSVANKCPICGCETEIVRKISFVDAPGHETLMATMLTGAATMDGALLVIAANEPCPQPQTKEHLKALEIGGVKNIIIIQNKIDLVDDKRANESYQEIKKFVKGTIAENAPIIPVSAQYNANIDLLLETIEKVIPTPKRDLTKEPIFLVARSFDINKPGHDASKIIGCVLGGVLRQGKLKVNEEIEILPGMKKEVANKIDWKPISTKIASLIVGSTNVNELVPGGSGGIGTTLDPFIGKSDALVGQVIGLKGKMPVVWKELDLDVHLLERVVGSKEELETQPLKVTEPILINAWTARTVGVISKISNNKTHMILKAPICMPKGEKIVLSRRFGQKWRLVGYGIIQ